MIDYFVVGATARDIMLDFAYHVPIRRATKDIDIAIRVSDWNDYDRLANKLMSTGQFQRSKRGHRFTFRDGEPIDIVPFGEIGGTEKSITWPSTESFVMGVLGFEEAFRSAVVVMLRREPALAIRVSTLAGLAVMKLISWDEAYPERAKDAQDFYLVANWYVDAGNYERVMSEDLNFSRLDNLDRTLSGARLLGRDMASIADGRTHSRLNDIFTRETDPGGSLRLVQNIAATSITLEEEFDNILRLIESVRIGFQRPTKQK
ncbi:MAG: nucleotidyl transferase AbiEii/AbiGii toxin family protein, partial [Bacteroidota bacterium]